MTVRGIPIIYYGYEQSLAYYDDNNNTSPEDINCDDDPYNGPGRRAGARIRQASRLSEFSPICGAKAERSRPVPAPVYADTDSLVFDRPRASLTLEEIGEACAPVLTLRGFCGSR
jgi:hypothetical protein